MSVYGAPVRAQPNLSALVLEVGDHWIAVPSSNVWLTASGSLIAGGSTTVVPGIAGNYFYVTAIHATTSAAIDLQFLSGATVFFDMQFVGIGTIAFNFPPLCISVPLGVSVLVKNNGAITVTMFAGVAGFYSNVSLI